MEKERERSDEVDSPEGPFSIDMVIEGDDQDRRLAVELDGDNTVLLKNGWKIGHANGLWNAWAGSFGDVGVPVTRWTRMPV